MTDLTASIEAALAARAGFFARISGEDTDAYRLFHGVAEGRPGLSIDRYGALVLVQTFREPLDETELASITELLRARLAFELVWNHRGTNVRASAERPREVTDDAFVAREFGVRYAIAARHRGQDPWLFLDLRAGRRRLKELCAGKTVLNLFAYTGAAGICAVAHGAREAWNVDFARSSLDVSARHRELNDIGPERLTTIREDVFPIVLQLAGIPVKGRASARSYLRVEQRAFDIVFLDPPARAASPFGAVDVERDYPSLFKPAWLACAEGGVVIATNHVARVAPEEFAAILRRTAEKCGRPVRALEMLAPDDDFPSFDGRKPLKIAVCHR